MSGPSGRIRKLVAQVTHLDLLVGLALAVGLVLRVQVATSYGIFLDEGLNYPLSLTFITALTHAPFEPAGFSADPLKPQFFRLAYGPATWGAFGFGPIPSRQLVYNVVLPTSGLTAGRLFAAALDAVLAAGTYVYLRRTEPILAVLVTGFVFLNPVGTFWETVMYTHYLFVPLTVLLLVALARPRGTGDLSDLLAGALFGLLLSVQYYALIFLLLPFVADWLQRRGTIRPRLEDRLAELLQLYGVFLAVAGVVFYALNPLFWTEPVSSFQSIVSTQFLSQGNTLTTSSGVAGVPTFFGGGSHLVTPWYFPVEIFAAETPTLWLPLLPIGVWTAIRALRSRAPGFVDRVALLAAVALASELAFSAPIQHFHSWADINLYLGPAAVLAAVGALGVVYWWRNRRSVPVPSPTEAPGSNSGSWRRPSVSRSTIAVTLLVAVLALSTSLEVGAGPTYTNLAADLTGRSGANLVGAYGSPQADGLMGKYLSEVQLSNVTLLTLGFTVSIDYYSPPEKFVQLWQPVSTSLLEQSYRGDYLVIDEWYVQLWGNPIPPGDANFAFVHSINVTGGYCRLYEIRPLLVSVSPIYATQAQQIEINGTGLGTAPQVVPTGVAPFVDTVLSTVTPSLAIAVSAPNGTFLWEAGLASANGSDLIGVSIASWNDSQIVLGGFGPNVVATGSTTEDPYAYTLSPGDGIQITVHAPENSGTSHWTSVVRSSPQYTLITGLSALSSRATTTLRIDGTGFGNGPILVPLSGGFSDTRSGLSAPTLGFDVLDPSLGFLWEAGLAGPTGQDAVGIQLLSWNSTSIVLIAFGPNYFEGAGSVPPGMFTLEIGDIVIVQLIGMPGSGSSSAAERISG